MKLLNSLPELEYFTCSEMIYSGGVGNVSQNQTIRQIHITDEIMENDILFILSKITSVFIGIEKIILQGNYTTEKELVQISFARASMVKFEKFSSLKYLGRFGPSSGRR